MAVTGKGGSGKTMLTALLTGILARDGRLRTLAIDADSAISLPYALGMKVTVTVAEIRRQIIEDPYVKAEIDQRPMRDVMAEALVPGKGFDLLVMGRPEGPGCYCYVNDLLRYGIERLSKDFDVTLVDCEAGPEQVNRRVVKGVDVLIIVTDGSLRGMQAARAITEVARTDEEMRSTRTYLVVNRFKTENRLITAQAADWNLEVLGFIPEDETLAEYDSIGKPLIELPDTSPSLVAAREIVRKLFTWY